MKHIKYYESFPFEEDWEETQNEKIYKGLLYDAHTGAEEVKFKILDGDILPGDYVVYDDRLSFYGQKSSIHRVYTIYDEDNISLSLDGYPDAESDIITLKYNLLKVEIV